MVGTRMAISGHLQDKQRRALCTCYSHRSSARSVLKILPRIVIPAHSSAGWRIRVNSGGNPELVSFLCKRESSIPVLSYRRRPVSSAWSYLQRQESTSHFSHCHPVLKPVRPPAGGRNTGSRSCVIPVDAGIQYPCVIFCWFINGVGFGKIEL